MENCSSVVGCVVRCSGDESPVDYNTDRASPLAKNNYLKLTRTSLFVLKYVFDSHEQHSSTRVSSIAEHGTAVLALLRVI